jgi:signal transduction histidine kinase
MKINSIVTKLGLTILLTIMVILLPLGFVTNKIFTNFYYSEIHGEIESLSSKYASSVSNLRDKDVLRMFSTLADFTNKEIVVVDEQGTIVVNSGVNVLKKGSSIPFLQFKLLKEGIAVEQEFGEEASNDRYISIGKPVINKDQFMGAIFVLAPISDLDSSVNKFQNVLLLAGIGSLLIASGITLIVSKKLASPLLEMENATREISKGNLDTRVTVHSNDEIGLLAKAINELSEEIKRYRDYRREFFANISHELKTPITYLKGYAKVLKNGQFQSQQEQEQYLEIIEAEADRLSSLVNDLFELSKLEEGKIRLEFQEVDLSEVIENVLVRASVNAQEKGLLMFFHKNEVVPAIMGDGLRLEQVLTNLIENAIRYTERGSVEIDLSHNKNDVIVTILDTGIGISTEELPFIFERFYRVEKSRSRHHGGTGLGLSIAKQLVNLHEGTISVKSELGKGTVFKIAFPIYRGDVNL